MTTALRRSLQSAFSAPPPTTSRIHSIDLLRGIAALTVLIYHYQHFFLTQPDAVLADPSHLGLPFYNLLAGIFAWGDLAVQMFWTISGFVFAAIYVSSRATTRQFAAARFARLYPLNLITLFVLTSLQLLSVELTGETKIYGNFDIYHLLLNIGFISGWGFERGFSFNGPIWSVSIELLVYAIFWIALPRLFRLGVAGPLLIATIFLTGSLFHLGGVVWQCGFYFFAGTAVYVAHKAFSTLIQTGFALCLIGTSVASIFVYPPIVPVGSIIGIVILVAALEPALKNVARRMDWLGDNTYSLYLWHVPVQVAILLVVNGRALFNSPWFFCAYIVGMMGVARASFLFIERPTRDYLRGSTKRMPPSAGFRV